MSSEEEEWPEVEEIRVLTKKEEISVLKARQNEQTNSVEKLYALDDVIIAELAAVMAVEYDEEFFNKISTMLDKQDLNREAAQNWIDNGRDPTDFYAISCHNRLNNMGMILVLVESRAIRLGIVEMDRPPSIPELFKERLRDRFMVEVPENGGGED